MPGALGAEHEHRPGRHVDLPRRGAALGLGRVAPEVGALACGAGARRGSWPSRSRTCSTAPAEALATIDVTPAEPWRGSTRPSAPAPSQARTIAPRLRGSVTPSSTTTSGCGARQQLERVGVRVGIAERDHALVVGTPGEARDAPRPARHRRARRRRQPRRATACSAVRSVQTTSRTRRCPRSASRTGCTP